MAKLDRTIARNIVTEAIAIRSDFRQSDVREHLNIINDLKIDPTAMDAIERRIAHQVESIGFRAKFSRADFSQAGTVGDLIQVVVNLTESGGPD